MPYPTGAETSGDIPYIGQYFDKGGAVYNVMHPDLGAVGDGTTDDRAAIAAADTAANGATVFFPAGTYLINSNITITSPVQFAGNATLKPASGVTVTISGGVTAGLYQIFDRSSGGLISLSGISADSVEVEWFDEVTSEVLMESMDSLTNSISSATTVSLVSSITEGTGAHQGEPPSDTGSYMGVNLSSDQAVAPRIYAAFDCIVYHQGPGWDSSYHTGDVYEIVIADQTNLAGNTVTRDFPLTRLDNTTIYEIRVDVSSLSVVRSMAIRSKGDPWPGKTNRRRFVIDNFRMMKHGKAHAALVSGAKHIVVRDNYTQPSGAPPIQLTSSQSITDHRPNRQNRSSVTGGRTSLEYDIPTDGSRDVSFELQEFISSAEWGETLRIVPGKYQCNTGLWIHNKKNLTINCEGADFYRNADVGAPATNDNYSMFVLRSCQDIKVLGGVMRHYRTDEQNGSDSENISGAAINGTSMELDTQLDELRLQYTDDDDPGKGMYAYYIKEQYPSAVQTLLDTDDPDFDEGTVFKLTLSDSNQVSNDCLVWARAMAYDGVISANAFTTGLALDASQTSVAEAFLDLSKFRTSLSDTRENIIQLDNEFIKLEQYSGGWQLERGVYGTTGAAHSVGTDVYRVVSARLLTLTASPTDYTLIVRERGPHTTNNDFDRTMKYDVHVRKNTATANTIDLSGYQLWGHTQFSAANEETHGFLFQDQAERCIVQGWRHECSLGDAVAMIGPEDIQVLDALGYCAGRQGMSVTKAHRVKFKNVVLISTGRSGLDIEPFGSSQSITNCVVEDFQMWRTSNGGLVSPNVWNYDHRYTNIQVNGYGIAAPFLIGGDQINATNLIGMGALAGQEAGLEVVATNAYIENVWVDRAIRLKNGSSGVLKDAVYGQYPLYVDDNSVWRVENVHNHESRNDAMGGGVGTGTDGGHDPMRSKRGYLGDMGNVGRKFTRSFGGTLISPILRGYGGLSFGGESIVDMSGFGALEQTGTILSSASRSSTSTTSSTDLGSDETRGRLRLRIECTTVSAGTTLDVELQTSHDNTNWLSMGQIEQLPTAGDTDGPSADWPHVEFLHQNVLRYIRLVYTISGGGSVTFAADYKFWATGNNFVMPEETIGASTTSLAVTFPGVDMPLSDPQNLYAVDHASGALTDDTYYYRVGARTWNRGPSQWDAERNATVANPTTDAVLVIMNDIGRRDQLSTGVYASGVTILRGTTSGGPYTTRYDVFPLATFPEVTTVGLNDVGSSVIPNSGNQYLNAAAQSGSWTAVDESGYEPDTNYTVQCAGWDFDHGGWWITSKTRSGFTINWANTAPGGGGVVTPIILR